VKLKVADGELKFLRESTMQCLRCPFFLNWHWKKRQRISSALLWRGVVARREWIDDTVSIYEGPGSHILDRLEWNYWKRRPLEKGCTSYPAWLLSSNFIFHFCFSPYKRKRKDRRGIWCILSCSHCLVAISVAYWKELTLSLTSFTSNSYVLSSVSIL